MFSSIPSDSFTVNNVNDCACFKTHNPLTYRKADVWKGQVTYLQYLAETNFMVFLLPPILQHVYSINKIKVIKSIDKMPKLWWGTDVFVCYKLNLLHKFKLIFIFSYPGVVKSSCCSSSNGDWKTVKQINFITSISRYKHNNIPCYNCKYSQTCPNGHLCIVVTWS